MDFLSLCRVGQSALCPVSLEGGRLAKVLAAVIAGVRPLLRVGPHVATETRRLEEALLTDGAKVGTLVGVLLAMQNDRISIGEPVKYDILSFESNLEKRLGNMATRMGKKCIQIKLANPEIVKSIFSKIFSCKTSFFRPKMRFRNFLFL